MSDRYVESILKYEKTDENQNKGNKLWKLLLSSLKAG